MRDKVLTLRIRPALYRARSAYRMFMAHLNCSPVDYFLVESQESERPHDGRQAYSRCQHALELTWRVAST